MTRELVLLRLAHVQEQESLRARSSCTALAEISRTLAPLLGHGQGREPIVSISFVTVGWAHTGQSGPCAAGTR